MYSICPVCGCLDVVEPLQHATYVSYCDQHSFDHPKQDATFGKTPLAENISMSGINSARLWRFDLADGTRKPSA